MNDETRLPKWAQQELGRLRRDLAAATSQINQLTGKEPSPITYRVMMEEPTNIPIRSTVEFKLSEINSRISCRINQYGWLDVSGDDSLCIQPRASNQVWIKLLK